MKRLSKFEIIAGILGFLLIPLLVYFYTFILIMFGPSKALNTEIEEELMHMRARGEPVSLKELAPPLVPKSENAAFIHQEVFKKIEEIPEEAIDLLSKSPSELTPEERTTIKDVLDKNKEGFSLIEKSISYKRYRFPIDYEKGYKAELPHLRDLKDCARLLALKSLWELARGNAEEAINVSLQTMKVGEALSTEPLLISQLVRISIGSIMIRSLEKVLTEGDVSPKTLKRLIDILGTYQKDIGGGLKLALLGERCLFTALFQNPEKFFLEEIGPDIPLNQLKYIMGSRFMKSDELYGLRIYKKLIDFAQLPLSRAIRESRELEAEVNKDWEETWDMIWLKPWKFDKIHIFSSLMLPAINESFVVWTRHDAKIEEAMIAVALELYKREHGVYPEDLGEISPHILSPLPKDPFTGEDFIYRKEIDSFILYSVGENLKDDGGVVSIYVKGKEKEKADIVWGQY